MTDDPLRILTGDCRETMSQIPDGTVQTCVTSPPYWGLRSYLPAGHNDKHREIGSEPTPEAFVETMVEVFREVRRCLHESGTLWLNLGDSYAANGGAGAAPGVSAVVGNTVNGAVGDRLRRTPPSGIKPKDLCMIPWRVALALQADGWWLRSVICWHKKSCMPESVTDRPTNSWEPIFLLAKSAKYFMDMEAVKEPVAREWDESNGSVGRKGMTPDQNGQSGIGFGAGITNRNQRNVYGIPAQYCRMRSDLTPEQKEKLVAELLRRGIL